MYNFLTVSDEKPILKIIVLWEFLALKPIFGDVVLQDMWVLFLSFEF